MEKFVLIVELAVVRKEYELGIATIVTDRETEISMKKQAVVTNGFFWGLAIAIIIIIVYASGSLRSLWNRKENK